MAFREDGKTRHETNIAELMKKTSTIADDFKTLMSENEHLLTVVHDKSTQIETLNNQLLSTEGKLRSLEKELTQCQEKELQLRQEHATLISSLDHAEGGRSATESLGNSSEESNSPIADLSDRHRPTRLAELFNDVYESQWPEAMKVIENELKDREQAVDLLRNILCEIKSYCDKKARDQIEELQAFFLRPDSVNHSVTDPVIEEQLKCNRQQSAEHSVKEVFQTYWSFVSNNTSKCAQLSLKVKPYIEECFKICWLMAVHDPPIVLGTIPHRGEAYDKIRYTAYNRSGSLVEFVVWPPLFLYVGGPILCKGIAQGCETVQDRKPTLGMTLLDQQMLSTSPYRMRNSSEEKTRTILGEISSQIDCLEDHVNSVQISTVHAKDTNQVAEIRSLKDQLKAKDDIIKKYAMTKTSKPTDDILQQYEIQMEKIEASNIKLKQDLQKKEKLLKTAVSREKNFKDDIANLEKDVQRLGVELQRSEKELDETRNRFSEYMGTNPTDINPNIADLPDQNRPTKLGERYSQLYDNPWTEAYEALEKHIAEEQKIIEVLRNILVNAFKHCENKANEQMQQLQDVFFRPEAKRGGNLDPVRKQLKDFRKASVEKTAKEHFQSYWSDLKKQSSKLELAQLSLHVKEYVEDCFTICWMMAVQDPPVVLGSIPERGNAFDQTMFRAYTQSGLMVEYVVWPPLCLHSSGPILSKGVAQGYCATKSRGTRNTTQRDMGHQADARRSMTEGGREDVLQSRHAAVPNAEYQRGYEAGGLGYGDRSPGDTSGYGGKSPGAQHGYVSRIPEDKQIYVSPSPEDKQGYVSRSPENKQGYEQENSTRKQDVWQDYTERSSKYDQAYSSRNTPQYYTYSRQSAATKSPPDRPNSASRKGRPTPTKGDMELYIKYLKSGGSAHAKKMLGDDLYMACLFKI